MYTIPIKRGLGLAMTLTLALSGIPANAHAAEEDGLCDHHSVHTTDCGYSESSSCKFKLEGCDECLGITDLKTIIGTDVLISGHSFPYTGEAICPEITVTVEDTVLTEGEHYQLTYENNIQPGEAAVTVTGIREAGYDGLVTIAYTITPVSEPEATEPEATEPENTEPEATEKPDAPEEQDPTEETKPVEYQITKGSGSTWYQGSGKDLSFTANGKGENFTAVAINGKLLNASDYTVSGNTVVTLKKSVLNKLAVGKYTVTIRYADGEATGTFSVSDRLDTTNPVTGDQSNVTMWALLAAGSLTGLGAMALTLGRKKKK